MTGSSLDSHPDSLDFWKMHGAGNDFVVTAPPARPERSDAGWAALAREICDRHFGIGADGLILSLPSDAADRRMRIFNADGSEAEMCGNGIRCFVKFVLDGGAVAAADGAVTVETIPGVLSTRAAFDEAGLVTRVRVSMGVPALRPQDVGARVEQQPPVLDLPLDVPLEAAGDGLRVTLVSIGNPHAVQLIEGAPGQYPLERIGPAVEHHTLFANRTNFEVVRVLDRSRIEMRVWERGVGETLACGSGAAAAVVAARLHGLVDDAVEVTVPGGALRIDWDGTSDVYLDGPATRVFEARWGGSKNGGPAR